MLRAVGPLGLPVAVFRVRAGGAQIFSPRFPRVQVRVPPYLEDVPVFDHNGGSPFHRALFIAINHPYQRMR